MYTNKSAPLAIPKKPQNLSNNDWLRANIAIAAHPSTNMRKCKIFIFLRL